MGASVYRITSSGAGAVALSSTVPSGACYRVVSVGVHLSAAPTSAGSLTVTLDSIDGPEHDLLIDTTSMIGVTDYLYLPDQDWLVIAGDAVDVAYANPDGRTYGARITLKAV